jgi:hypothetical protein
MVKQITRACSIALILALALAARPTASVHADYLNPDVLLISISPDPAVLGELVVLNARGASNNGFPDDIATILEVVYSLNGGSDILMTPVDGAYDYWIEDVTASFTAATLGENVVCFRALDSLGYWTDPDLICQAFYVYPPPDTTGPTTSAVAASPDPAFSGGLVTVNASVDDSANGGHTIAAAEFSVNSGAFTAMIASDGAFDAVSESVTGSFTAGAVGTTSVCVRGEDALGNWGTAACVDLTVESGYVFGGFSAPVQSAGTKAHAGHSFPLRFTLTMAGDGGPVTDPAAITGVMSYDVDCSTLAGDPSSADAEAGSLDYLGNGLWRFNWQIPDSYADSCRMVFVSLSDGSASPEALFRFK